MNRRDFLKVMGGGLVCAAGISLATRPAIAGLPKASSKIVSGKALSIHNIHTGEKLKATFWEKGHFVNGALEELNHLFRDFRTGDVAEIDPKLFNLLYAVQKKTGVTGKEIEVICGYRSEASNEMLREKSFAKHRGRSSGVAKQSYHLLGQAVDINIPGVSLKGLKNAALAANSGGVGYYPRSGFVHIDTGPVRKWGAA